MINILYFTLALLAFAIGWYLSTIQTRKIVKQELEKLIELQKLKFAAFQEQKTPIPANEEELDSERVAIIASAIAAYLGKEVHVRRIRRIFESESNLWAHRGRASIQGSHGLPKISGIRH